MLEKLLRGVNMKLQLLLVVIITSLVFFSCVDKSNDPIIEPIRELTAVEKKLVASADNFSFKIFKKIYEADAAKNIFVSPLSISMALGMTLNGADGTTFEAMRNTLSLGDFTREQSSETYQSLISLLTSADSKVAMKIANSIWYNKNFSFQNDFIEMNKKYFNAQVSALNFQDAASVSAINNWVKTATNDKILKIVESISPETIMYLINAVYFKAAWKAKFDAAKTRDDFFITESGIRVPIKMMEQETDLFAYSNNLYTMVDLPYGNGNFSMTLLLPAEGKKLSEVAATLTKESFDSSQKYLASSKKHLYLPRFKNEYKIKLNKVLQELGMSEAFDAAKANFKKLYSGPQNAYISDVDHKTFVEVNEEGTEAAAVTSVSIGVTSIMNNIIRFDRPFMYLIREKNSGAIIFAGTMVDPSLIN